MSKFCVHLGDSILAISKDQLAMALNPKITDWQGLSVWLVGASSGIGLATAKALHQRGARVAISARNEQALQAFVDQHPGSMALPLDVGEVQALHEAARSVIEAHGPH